MELSVGSSIALSVSSQSHRFNICVDQYVNNEAKMRVVSNITKNMAVLRPPTRIEGDEVVQYGLTTRGRSKVKFGARIMHHCCKGGKAAFITLTYGSIVPPDRVAKKQLDIFLKRLRRRYGNFLYLWVAENQKRGAIHFHLAANIFIPKEEINEHWNDIVNKWMRKNDYAEQELYPQVQGVDSIGNYMAKYISKKSVNNTDGEDENSIDGNGNMARTFICGNLYGISMQLRKLMKPKRSASFQIELEQKMMVQICAELFVDASNTLNKKNDRAACFTYQVYSNAGIWLSHVDIFRFLDFVNYEMPLLIDTFETYKFDYARAG